MKRQIGNTASEYGIIGALIVCGSIGAMNLLGAGLNLNLDNFMGALSQSNEARHASIVQVELGANPVLPDAIESPKSVSTGSLQGVSLQETSALIQVAGANGTTRELLSVLENRIAQMKAAGEITKEEGNLLHDLANSGHYLADAEKLLEDAYASGQSKIVFEGRTYLISDFASNVIGFNKALSTEGRWEMNLNDANPAMRPFAETFAKVKQSAMFANPVVKQKISGITLQIASLDDALSWCVDNMVDQGYPPNEWSQRQGQLTQDLLNTFKTNTEGANVTASLGSASALNHADSGQICTTGNEKDNGKNCSK